MNIRLAGPISVDSIVDGNGLRTVIWTQGCPHACRACHNPETWSPMGGYDYDVDQLVDDVKNVEFQSGVTFSGGDPFFQKNSSAYVARRLKLYSMNIWCYTGYLYEELLNDLEAVEFLKYIDVLVDGPFVESLKTYDKPFRGSSNQRLIDVQESLRQGKMVLWSER